MTETSVMPHSDYRDRIQQILSEQLNIEVSSVDEDLIDSGLLDSLTFVELLYQIEQQLGVTVELESLELDDLRSVAKIGRFVAGRING